MKRVASALVLLALAIALYRKAIRLWWTYDDALHLHLALSRLWSEGFTAGDVWPQKLFTPFLLGTNELLLQFAGLEADRWYRVQLALIAVAGIAVFLALRLFMQTTTALCGALLFVAGPPLCSIATQLMTIHYLEAVALGALSVTLYVLAYRRQSLLLEVLSALLYFAAMLAKEIAIPLPALLFFLPEKSVGVRVRHLLFHALAAIGYFGWRYAVVDTFLGGYGWVVTPGELPGVIVALPWKVIAAWAGAGLGFGLLAIALLALGVGNALRQRRALIIAVVALVLAIAPIVPVSKEMQPRYALASWLWVCATFAIGAASLKLAPRVALCGAALALVIVANRQEWTHEYARSKRMSDEARTYMNLDPQSLLRNPAVPPAAMGELQWLKEQHLRRPAGAGWFYDDLFLCGPGDDGKKVYEYVAARKEVVEVTARIPDFAAAYCGSIRDNAPLRAEFHHRDGKLFWRFGPYVEGRWSVVLFGGVQAFHVPREDGFFLGSVPGLVLRIRYDSPHGWVTYSPEIPLDFAKQPDFTWHR